MENYRFFTAPYFRLLKYPALMLQYYFRFPCAYYLALLLNEVKGKVQKVCKTITYLPAYHW
ncbi:MAG: hypothetical protein ACLVAW_12215 [Eisenbergiella massiliensis]